MQYIIQGDCKMSFQIRPDKKESINKTIRFPKQLNDDIEFIIKGQDVTFSGFVIQACEYALKDMRSDTDDNGKGNVKGKSIPRG